MVVYLSTMSFALFHHEMEKKKNTLRSSRMMFDGNFRSLEHFWHCWLFTTYETEGKQKMQDR